MNSCLLTRILYSFKSKRYRDKLRAEVKALEALLPVDRPALGHKLDSQAVYRLVIAYLRINAFLKSSKLYSRFIKCLILRVDGGAPWWGGGGGELVQWLWTLTHPTIICLFENTRVNGYIFELQPMRVDAIEEMCSL